MPKVLVLKAPRRHVQNKIFALFFCRNLAEKDHITWWMRVADCKTHIVRQKLPVTFGAAIFKAQFSSDNFQNTIFKRHGSRDIFEYCQCTEDPQNPGIYNTISCTEPPQSLAFTVFLLFHCVETLESQVSSLEVTVAIPIALCRPQIGPPAQNGKKMDFGPTGKKGEKMAEK